jgi:hypothetical protein
MSIRKSLTVLTPIGKMTSAKVVSYLYVGGLKVGALRANIMTNWQASNLASLIALQNDVAKNSLWRSTAVNIPRSGNSSTT